MDKLGLTDLLAQNKIIQNWLGQVDTGRQLVMGLSVSSKALAIATAFQKNQGKFVIVTSTQNEAEKLISDLSALLDEKYLYSFFADDVAAAEFIFSSLDRTLSRLESLNFLQDNNASGILVTSIIGTKILLPNPEVYHKAQIKLSIGVDKELDKLVKQLSQLGYERVSQVLSPGEYSRRGDILDIYEVTGSQIGRAHV